MREFSMTDLFLLTRVELLRLDHDMVIALATLPPHHEHRTLALINQRRIRRELGRRDLERGLCL